MHETSSPLKPGDAVVPLAALSHQCGAIAGAISVGVVLGRGHASWWIIVLGVLAGLVSGLLVGGVVGRWLFPSRSPGQVFVVLAGRAALPLTLRAASIPAVLAGIGLAMLAAAAFGTPMWPDAMLSGLLTALSVGLCFGVGAALL
jgi:hypothetical protein